MANIKIKESDSSISDTLATGAGSGVDPKIPHFAMHDPVSGLTARLEQTGWGKEVSPVHVEHVHDRVFNTHMAQASGTIKTLTAAAAKNTRVLALNNVTDLIEGNKIQIRTATFREPDYRRIQSINGNNITIDALLDVDYPIGAEVEKYALDLNVLGSLVAPQSFKYYPRPGKVQHLENLVVYMRSSAIPYFSTFGGIAGLANGVHLRKYNGADSTFQTMDIFRINQRFVQSGWSVEFGERAGPADSYSTIATYNELDITNSMFRLVADNGDYFEAIVLDDLAALVGFEIKLSGHEEI